MTVNVVFIDFAKRKLQFQHGSVIYFPIPDTSKVLHNVSHIKRIFFFTELGRDTKK